VTFKLSGCELHGYGEQPKYVGARKGKNTYINITCTIFGNKKL